jgi:hypothetical protein
MVRYSELSLPFKFSNQNIVCISQFSSACYMPCPTHPPLFDHFNNIHWSVHVMKFIIVQSSAAFHHLLPFRSTYSPQHPVLKYPQSLFFLWCERLSFTPIQKAGKIVVLYILIVKFLESKWEDKILWTDWPQAFPEFNLLLISLWMQFWFVTVILKYLNFAAFQEV